MYVGVCAGVCRCVGGWAGCCLNLELMRDRDEVRQKRGLPCNSVASGRGFPSPLFSGELVGQGSPWKPVPHIFHVQTQKSSLTSFKPAKSHSHTGRVTPWMHPNVS